MPPEKQQQQDSEKNKEDMLRLISLLQSVQNSSANPFEINIREKLQQLKKQLPGWKLLDDLLLDSVALHQLVEIMKLQEQWLKHRASSLYIDPLLLELKLRLLSRDELADSLVRSWHPIVQLDQLTPRALERAFVYWRDLVPFSERFRQEFGKFGTAPGEISYEQLVEMKIFTGEQFDSRLEETYQSLLKRCSSSQSGEINYRDFIESSTYEEKVVKAYVVAFLVTDGRVGMRVDPLTEMITIYPLKERAAGETSSIAIEVGKVQK